MTVVAYDYDDSATENGTVSFMAIDVPEDEFGALFAMDSNGVVTTVGNRLDREQRDIYYMKVRASDGGNPSMSSKCYNIYIHTTR